jgi:hypothetical protein
MEKDSQYYVVIKPEKGTKLKFKKEETKQVATDRLPAHVGTIFKSNEEVKEEFEMKRFKDFLK